MVNLLFTLAIMLNAIHISASIEENSSPEESEVSMPNDPLFKEQWGLFNRTFGHDIGVLQAWEIEKGNKNVAIAIIGTGVDYTHPDLTKNMWINPGEIAGNGIDDDNNGYIDDIHGINAITGSGDPMDDHGHETFAAGIIGAEVNNGISIAGIMHDVSLIACKFLSDSGGGSTEGAIACLDYVASLAKRSDTGVTIIATSNAWGGGPHSEALEKAIARHRDLGILFVATAGNGAENLDNAAVYPASYQLANVIAVGKMNEFGRHVLSGSYGQNTVHVAAPGLRINSTWLNGGYSELNGSLSTAFVSGVLGLLKSHNLSLSAVELKNMIVNGAETFSDADDRQKYISGGYVNAFNSLQL